MISLIHKTDTCRAVYFDGSSNISQITNQILDTKDLFAWFEMEDITPFLDGSLKFSDYIVSRTDNPLVYEIIKTRVDIKRRNKDNQLHKVVSSDDADITLSLTDDGILFEANDKLKKSIGVDPNQLVSVAGKSEHVFFITHKDRPEFLIKTVLIPFSELLSTGKHVNLVYNKYSISVYTQKYFDKYSWRRV
tara:strand:- start:1745 stop:2317 length:573 start_codon:yes stop_codon:yes gene_type:complete